MNGRRAGSAAHAVDGSEGMMDMRSSCCRSSPHPRSCLPSHRLDRDMGNATTTVKGPDSRPFSPDFEPAAFSPRDLTASPHPEDGLNVPKNKLLLSQHSTEDRDNEDDRIAEQDCQVSCIFCSVILKLTSGTGQGSCNNDCKFVNQRKCITNCLQVGRRWERSVHHWHF